MGTNSCIARTAIRVRTPYATSWHPLTVFCVRVLWAVPHRNWPPTCVPCALPANHPSVITTQFESGSNVGRHVLFDTGLFEMQCTCLHIRRVAKLVPYVGTCSSSTAAEFIHKLKALLPEDGLHVSRLVTTPSRCPPLGRRSTCHSGPRCRWPHIIPFHKFPFFRRLRYCSPGLHSTQHLLHATADPAPTSATNEIAISVASVILLCPTYCGPPCRVPTALVWALAPSPGFTIPPPRGARHAALQPSAFAPVQAQPKSKSSLILK